MYHRNKLYAYDTFEHDFEMFKIPEATKCWESSNQCNAAHQTLHTNIIARWKNFNIPVYVLWYPAWKYPTTSCA